MRRVVECAALSVLLLTLLPQPSAAATSRWNGLSGDGFTQAFARTDCPDQIPCQDDDFSLQTTSIAECNDWDPTVLESCFAESYVPLGWELSSSAGYFPAGGDTDFSTRVWARGTRVSAELFEVSGSVEVVPGNTAEVAVFRFAGDPTIFDGVEAESAYDLVALGLISAGDILAVATLDANSGPLDLQADVTGLADVEIVLFAAADGPIPNVNPAFSSLAAESYSYCYAHTLSFIWEWPFPCEERCENSDFEPAGDCFTTCTTTGAHSRSNGTTAWTVSGETNWGHGDFGSISAEGQLAASDTFLLSGTQLQYSPAVKPKIAVFRYAGDPAAFDSLAPFSVYQLVEWGLITEDDILFAHDFAPGENTDFSFEIDVDGVSPDEIVVFASGRALYGDNLAVPATTATGTVLLALALLGLGAWVMRRRLS